MTISNKDKNRDLQLIKQLEEDSKLRGTIINYFIYFVGSENPLPLRIYALMLLTICFAMLLVFSTMIISFAHHAYLGKTLNILGYVIGILILLILAIIPGVRLMLKAESIEQHSRTNSNFKKVSQYHQEQINNI